MPPPAGRGRTGWVHGHRRWSGVRRSPLHLVVELVAIAMAIALMLALSATPARGLNALDVHAQGSGLQEPWVGLEDGNEVIELYYVYSSTCPHCRAAMPFVASLEAERPWLRVWWIQADSDDREGKDLAIAVSRVIGEPVRTVPTFMFCGEMRSGFDSVMGIGTEIVNDLDACHEAFVESRVVTTTTQTDVEVAVPGIGDLRSSSVPLPVFTVLVAGLDAFNPCAFFVLLFLLSLLVHARSRSRMAAIGGLFVVVSGAMYFVFMAAWLNLFLVTDNLRWVTLAAGAMAAVLGVISLRDAFRSGSGLSTSIPESAKPGIYARTRNLVRTENMYAVVGATVALALVANSYELVCTAGLPMAFTRVLTLNDLPTSTYYGYLVLYNIVYVIPLLAIVGGFVWTLGSRKLQPAEGRILKVLSGTMMAGLGLALLFAPRLLEQVTTAAGIVAAAVVVTLIITFVERWGRRTSHV